MRARVGVALAALAALPALVPAAVDDDAQRREIKATLFVPDPLPPLAAEIHGRFEPAPGVVAERVTYNTQFGLRVPAILYLPKSHRGQAPALIIVNGHGGDKYSWYAFYSGILYARAGAAVLTYDPAGEGERNIERKSGTRAHDKVEPPAELARRLAGLMITDVSQAVSYLTQRPEVDAERIAAAGYSLGSFVLSLACAVETRLKACVLVGGGNLDGPNGYWDNAKPMCVGIPYRSLMFLGDRPAALYALHAARGPTLVYNGLEDTTVRIPANADEFFKVLQQRVTRLRGTAAGVFETGFVPGVGHRPFFVTRPIALWLERQLDFPDWSAESIAAMPETHISAWAKENGVVLDPLYASEHREGGTRALGAAVPGLSRVDLSVFAPEAWERQKDRLIHESWLKAAKAVLRRPAAPWPPPAGPLRVIIDTDAANEIDDQYALALALGTPDRLQLEGLVAAHYGDAGGAAGVEKSYAEIQRLLEMAGLAGKIPVKRGADPLQYRDRPPSSDGGAGGNAGIALVAGAARSGHRCGRGAAQAA